MSALSKSNHLINDSQLQIYLSVLSRAMKTMKTQPYIEDRILALEIKFEHLAKLLQRLVKRRQVSVKAEINSAQGKLLELDKKRKRLLIGNKHKRRTTPTKHKR